ncbi:hypothetical protein FJ434_01270 [Mesorhizobium sp. B2-5-13]|uniref:restriction endonuclease subunit S n=1 Tax=unclassified Mesorhizobium TaxID=325217 RepID=UPI00112D5CEA|nr:MULTISPECIES: restriction endonuclease subunit S [unclassified Mesorhizobium]TPJ43461.1 hypothetical protein FJ432_05920 [Mesorhizobium sp. B2-6-5]TPJ93357.1 hypothetical protein FJ434_01270 [Mesorhizobium sp. B2-5-13]TPK47558.1 hypothetical protein FJ560_17015 [Mesorhizobium sp. B2-5-5]
MEAVTAWGEWQEPVEGPWELPEGWVWAPLEAVALVNPPTAFQGTPDKEELAFVPMAAVSEETGRIALDQRRPAKDVAKGYVRFMEGDVIFAKITPCMENGKVAPVSGLPSQFGAGSTEFHVLRPKSIGQRYLWYWLVSRRFRQQAQRHMSGSAGQLRVPVDYLRRSLMPVPPLPEQRRIVTRIDELFAEIAEGEVALADAHDGLESFRRALLKSAVTGELTANWRAANAVAETGHGLLARINAERAAMSGKARGRRSVNAGPIDKSILPALPAGWTWATIGDLTEFVTSGSRGWKEFYADTGAIFVRAQNINSGKLDLTDAAFVQLPEKAEGLRTLIKRDDVLVTITGANVTVSARVNQDLPEAYVNQHIALLRLLVAETSEFVLLWLQAEGAGKSQLISAAYGAGKPGLNLDNIREVMVALPSPAEATEIIRRVHDALSAYSDTVAVLDAEAADATHLKQSILKAGFEGRLVPQDPDDEPATAMLARLASTQPAAARKSRGRPRKGA